MWLTLFIFSLGTIERWSQLQPFPQEVGLEEGSANRTANSRGSAAKSLPRILTKGGSIAKDVVVLREDARSGGPYESDLGRRHLISSLLQYISMFLRLRLSGESKQYFYTLSLLLFLALTSDACSSTILRFDEANLGGMIAAGIAAIAGKEWR